MTRRRELGRLGGARGNHNNANVTLIGGGETRFVGGFAEAVLLLWSVAVGGEAQIVMCCYHLLCCGSSQHFAG